MLSSVYSGRLREAAHQDSLLFGERVGTGVGECLLVRVFTGVLVFPGDIEILRFPTAMVSGDEILDYFGEIVLLGQLQPVRHMADDDFLCGLTPPDWFSVKNTGFSILPMS